MAEVKIKDRKEEVEYLRMAFNLAELNVNYTTADLINRLYKEVSKKKGKFTLEDGKFIFENFKRDWDKYFRDQESELTVKAEDKSNS